MLWLLLGIIYLNVDLIVDELFSLLHNFIPRLEASLVDVLRTWPGYFGFFVDDALLFTLGFNHPLFVHIHYKSNTHKYHINEHLQVSCSFIFCGLLGIYFYEVD